MATRRQEPKNEDRKAQERFMDQPGQWVNTTPPEVQKRLDANWEKFVQSLSPARRKQLGITGKK